MKYLIDIYAYIKQAIPFHLQKEPLQSWIKALLAPLQELNATFDVTAKSAKYEVSFTGQVIYLEHLLNDAYDRNQRRIYIEDGTDLILPPFLYNKIEDEPLYLYNKVESNPNPLYVYNKAEYASPVDFIVCVPTALLNTATTITISRLVEKYKIASKKFTIKPI